MYSYNILKDSLLMMLYARLESASSACKSDPTELRSLESVLHAWSSLADSVPLTEHNYLPKFLTALSTLPYHNNPTVLASALTAIGKFTIKYTRYILRQKFKVFYVNNNA